MTLTVEDGSLVPGADSYVGLAEADTYLAGRGRGLWPPAPAGAADPEAPRKEAALVRAADYLNGLNWKGRPAQGRIMAWPRTEVIDGYGRPVPPDTVPEAVKAAACRLAELALSGAELQPVLPRGGAIKSEAAGSLSVTYQSDAPRRDLPAFLADLLGGLIPGLADSGPTPRPAGPRTHRVVIA